MLFKLVHQDIPAESVQVHDTPKIVLHHLEAVNTVMVAVTFLQVNILPRPLGNFLKLCRQVVEIVNSHVN